MDREKGTACTPTAADGDDGGRAAQQLAHARRLLIVQYGARLPPRSTAWRWPTPRQVWLQAQHHIEQDLFGGEDLEGKGVGTSGSTERSAKEVARYAASPSYERAWLKETLGRIEDAVKEEVAERASKRAERGGGDILDEDDEPEVDEALLERYATILSRPASEDDPGSGPNTSISAGPPQAGYIHYYFPRPSAQASSGQDSTSNLTGKAGEHSIQETRADDDMMADFERITLREEGTTIARGTTGLKTWEASLRLAAHLLADPKLITAERTRILELGSGAGLLGCVCAKLQQSGSSQARGQLVDTDVKSARERGGQDSHPQIWMTDVPGQVLDRLEETLELNCLRDAPHVNVAPLDWLAADDESSQEPDPESPHALLTTQIRPQLILAADVVYDPSLFGPLARVLRIALSWPDIETKRGTAADPSMAESAEKQTRPRSYALIASTVRNEETYALFLRTLDLEDLVVTPTPLCTPESEPKAEAHSAMGLPLFPTDHDPAVAGRVQFVRVSLRDSESDSRSD